MKKGRMIWNGTLGLLGTRFTVGNYDDYLAKKEAVLQACLSEAPELTDKVLNAAQEAAENATRGDFLYAGLCGTVTALFLGSAVYNAFKKEEPTKESNLRRRVYDAAKRVGSKRLKKVSKRGCVRPIVEEIIREEKEKPGSLDLFVRTFFKSYDNGEEVAETILYFQDKPERLEEVIEKVGYKLWHEDIGAARGYAKEEKRKAVRIENLREKVYQIADLMGDKELKEISQRDCAYDIVSAIIAGGKKDPDYVNFFLETFFTGKDGEGGYLDDGRKIAETILYFQDNPKRLEEVMEDVGYKLWREGIGAARQYVEEEKRTAIREKREMALKEELRKKVSKIGFSARNCVDKIARYTRNYEAAIKVADAAAKYKGEPLTAVLEEISRAIYFPLENPFKSFTGHAAARVADAFLQDSVYKMAAVHTGENLKAVMKCVGEIAYHLENPADTVERVVEVADAYQGEKGLKLVTTNIRTIAQSTKDLEAVKSTVGVAMIYKGRGEKLKDVMHDISTTAILDESGPAVSKLCEGYLAEVGA